MIYSVTLWRNFFIFGLDRLNIITKPLNIIILYANYFIYTTRCDERQLVLEVYKKKLYRLFKILKNIDSEFMFCLQSYREHRIDMSLVY